MPTRAPVRALFKRGRSTSFWSSMRAQLLLVVGATLLPFAIFAIYVFTEQETAMQRGQTGGALEAAALVGGRFDERLRGLDILLLSVADAIGQDNDARNIQRKLETLKQADKGFFERILFVDDAGHVVASTENDPSIRDLGDRTYFHEAMRTDALVLTEPLVSRVSGKTVVVLARRAVAPDGRVKGIVALSLGLAAVQEWLREGAPPESAMLTLYTASGMVIGGTGESAQWIGRTRAIPDAKDALPAPYVASDLAAGTYRLRMMRAPWALIIDARDKNPGTVEWQRMTKTIAAALVSLIPGLLLAGLLSRRMTVSLERLGEGARRVAAGNLDYRLTEGTTREASVVAAEFNQMADRLQERQRQLAASEARFRSLTALSSDWYWEQDEHYRFTGLSRELHGKAGIGVEEHIGKTRWDLPTLDVTEAQWQAHRDVLDARKPFRDLVFERPSVNGRRYIVQVSGEPVFDSDARFKGYRGIGRNVTDRVLADRALQESEERYRTLYRRTPVMLHSIDTEGRLLDVSDYWLSKMGYARDEVIGRPLVDFMTPESREFAINIALPAFRRDGVSRDVMYRFIKKDGTDLDARLSATAERDAAGRMARSLTVATDITDEVRTQEALRDSERRWQFALEGAAAGVWDWDVKSGEVFRSRRLKEILGYLDDDLPVQREAWLDILHAEDKPRVLGELASYLEGKVPEFIAECRVRHKYGNYIWIQERGIVVARDREGRPRRVIGTVTDISGRKHAELQIQELLHDKEQLLERLQSQMELMPIGCLIYNAEHRVIFWNSAAERLFGYRADEITGRDAMDLLAVKEDRAELSHMRENLRGNHAGFSRTDRNMRADGRIIECEWHATPLADARGEYDGYMAMAQDITERRQAESEIRRLNEHLEQRVAERTAELTATVAELEAFSYSISHDLRAPLRAINGYAAIVGTEYAAALPEDARTLLTRIEASASRMARLIDGLLDFSRLGRAETTTGLVDMHAMVRDVIAEINSPPASVEITIGPLPNAHGDMAMLRQVWLNLLGNAVKFSGSQSQARIAVGGERGEDEVIYWVRDNGVGFDMAYAEKLFGVFNRLHRSDEFPGVGVGLAIVRRIIARHGGRVWARSRPQLETTFYFALPAPAAYDGDIPRKIVA